MRDDTSALVAAVLFKNAPVGIVMSLIDHGADLNLECAGIRDPTSQDTVLTLASYHGHAERRVASGIQCDISLHIFGGFQ